MAAVCVIVNILITPPPILGWRPPHAPFSGELLFLGFSAVFYFPWFDFLHPLVSLKAAQVAGLHCSL